MINQTSDRTLRQKSDIDKWIKSGAKGYFEWCTGSGKSYLACLAIKLCNDRHPDKQINVVVPTTVLQEAWIDERKGHIKVHGLKNVNVFVINSYVKETHDCALLIIDEVHTATGAKSKHFNTVIDRTKYNWILCLSATLEKEHVNFLHKKGISCISKLTADEAVKNGWLSPYRVLCVPIELNDEDRENYDKMHKEFNKHFATFNFDFEFAMKCVVDKQSRIDLATKLGWEVGRIDAAVFNWNRNMRLRKEFLYHVEAKIDAAIEITKTLQMQTILFGQSIKGADKINEALGDKCVEYHSKLTAKQLKDNLKKLRDGRTKVDYISSAKGLEAGFDLPNLQLGITWSRTSKALRATQTLGRILRKFEGKTAYFVELYVPETQDFRWLQTSLKGQKNVLWLNSIEQVFHIIELDKQKLIWQ
jgi:superfamily II DNA or RNA helicase